MTILIAILALSLLIIIHEVGHFTAAKLAGIRVLEFSLFMGPKLISRKKGETEYSIRLIPIGGYVRMEGEEEASDDERAYNKKPILTRAAVLAAGPLANLLVAFIIVIVLISSVGYSTRVLDRMDPYSPAAAANLQPGDEIISYDGRAIYQPSDIMLFLFGSKGKTAVVEYKRPGLDGIQKTTISPEIIEKNRYMLGYSPRTSSGEGWNEVAGIEQNANAAKEGLRVGDKILKLNGTPVTNLRDIRAFLKVNKGDPVRVTVDRNGTLQDITITPVRDNNEEQYDTGFTFKAGKGDLLTSAKQSVIYIYSLSREVYYSLAWLITGKVSPSQLSGPIGIVTTIGEVVQLSPTFIDKLLNLLSVMSFISINLGLFNLIPFPALDGSKLLLLAVEAVRRKALPPEKEALISLVGFAVLIMLMIFTVYNDILKLTTQ